MFMLTLKCGLRVNLAVREYVGIVGILTPEVPRIDRTVRVLDVRLHGMSKA